MNLVVAVIAVVVVVVVVAIVDIVIIVDIVVVVVMMSLPRRNGPRMPGIHTAVDIALYQWYH